ncbi:MAG: threonine aldolase [Candidatus Hinthialibacteria bacterium]
MTQEHFCFASDNCAGMCPEALEAFLKANQDYSPSYGDDPWTERASNLLREIFETDCAVYFCFTGTAANSMAIGHLCQSYHSVLCHCYAHVETDECGAPEFFTNGTKVILVSGDHGKVDPEAARSAVERRKDIHYPKPRVLSLTQATELGTVYSTSELQALAEVSKRYGMNIHMDGARLANAIVSLGISPAELTWKAGVDVLCLGGAKNGILCAEAVVFFNLDLAREFDFRCKQAGQLASKMRFMTAAWVGLLESGAWLENARHANSAAHTLCRRLVEEFNFPIRHPQQANSVFVDLPEAVSLAMHQRGWHFYSFIGSGGSRLMCSWKTSQDEIDRFIDDLRAVTHSL